MYIYFVGEKVNIQLDFVIDKLTNSIQNIVTGDSFRTVVTRLTKTDLRKVTKKNGWNFDWRKELNNNSLEVYKLSIEENTDIIQGLVSFAVESDHIYMNLLESAPFNIGAKKVYEGIAGNLVAFVCKTSFQRGHEGFVAFTAKTKLIEHYENTLGAYHFGGHKMIIPTHSAKILVEKYFKT